MGLIVVGLILTLAVSDQQVGPLNLGTAGWILALAGLLLLVLTMAQQTGRRRTSSVATTTDSAGRQSTTERRVDSDPPVH